MTQEEIVEAMKLLRPMYQQQPPPQMQDNDINPRRDFADPNGLLYGTPVMPGAPRQAPFVAQPRLDMREIDPYTSQPWARPHRGGA
jgi:hypothetical protein